MKLTEEQRRADGEVTLTERQLLEALRDQGHTEAAGVLAQKMTARAAIAAAVAAEHREAGAITPASAKAHTASGYEQTGDPAEQRRKRRERRGEYDPNGRSGHDEEDDGGDDE